MSFFFLLEAQRSKKYPLLEVPNGYYRVFKDVQPFCPGFYGHKTE